MAGERNLWTNNVSYFQGEWASVSEPHTSVFNVELCLYGSLISHTVTATTCAYCPAPFCLLHQAIMSNSETTLERHWQREKETMSVETRDKRATMLHRLCVATSLTLTPQCSTFTSLSLGPVSQLTGVLLSVSLHMYINGEAVSLLVCVALQMWIVCYLRT